MPPKAAFQTLSDDRTHIDLYKLVGTTRFQKLSTQGKLKILEGCQTI